MTGSEFQKIARQQVTGFGADLQNKLVTGIEKADGGFMVTTEDGAKHKSKYVVLAEGKGVKFSIELGLTRAARNVETGRSGQTSIDNLYVIGRSTNILRTQAIISAGAGATAALDILAIEAGENVTDWDSPPKD